MTMATSHDTRTQHDFALDRTLLRRRFAQAAAHYDEAAALAREVAQRMDERLDYLRISPHTVVDLGCGTGADLKRLALRYPGARQIGIDFALPMLLRARSERGMLQKLLRRATGPQLACADLAALPLPRASASMVWSNLALNWLADPLPALREMHRILEVGGVLMFSTLGPDTLKELRATLPHRDGERVHRFIDMHDIGDALVQAGFSDPVMDMEVITLTYTDATQLFDDLKRSGANNASTARPRGLSGKTAWQAARAALQALHQQGRLPATFEVIQGHAWKAAPKTTDDGRAVIEFRSKPTPLHPPTER